MISTAQKPSRRPLLWRVLFLALAFVGVGYLVGGDGAAVLLGSAATAQLLVSALQRQWPSYFTPGVATTVYVGMGLGVMILTKAFSWWAVILIVAYIMINVTAFRMQERWDNQRSWWS
jgi:hypothetical protein